MPHCKTHDMPFNKVCLFCLTARYKKEAHRTFRIGHPAYSNRNALKVVIGFGKAVEELRERGFTRDEARGLIKSAARGAYLTRATPGTNYDVVEIQLQSSWDHCTLQPVMPSLQR